MSMLTQLADVARGAGLKVVEVDGWKTRGRPASTGGFDPVGVLCHHTATGPSLSDKDTVALLVRGRSDLPGPLCQLGLARNGTVYVIAAGRGNHAGEAKASGTVAAGDGNRLYIGIEAFNDGRGEKWPAAQYDAYVKLCAALCDKVTGNSAKTVRGHKETSVTGKIDPTFPMDTFRDRVAAAMESDDSPKPPPPSKPPVAGVPAWRVEEATRAGIQNAATAARASTRAGLPFWAACALLEKESHGRNVFGHDVGGAGPHGQPVTRELFEAFYAKVLKGATSNGVGPCQITWAGSVANGKRDGGYFREMLAADLQPWDVEDNMVFGFNLLRKHYTAGGDSWEKAGTAYNGRASYGTDFLAKVKAWRERLDIKADLNPRLPEPKGEDAPGPKPPTERPPNPGPDDRPTEPPSEDDEYVTVKLRTYNCGGKERGQGMVKVLTGAREGATDEDWVVAWQEVGDQDAALEQIDALPGVDEVRGPKGLGRSKCALSVPDGTVRDEGLYDLTDRTKVGKPGAGPVYTDHKYVTWAKTDLGPVTINVASIHYISSVQGKDTDWREKRRELHAEQVGGTIEWAKTRAGHGPVFVLGDTNATPDSALLDAFRAANWTIHGTGSHGGANEDARAIDLLLVPPHQRVEVVNVRSLPGFGSDHRPVEYTVRIRVIS